VARGSAGRGLCVALVEISALSATGAIDAIASDAQREGAEHQSGHDRAVPRFNSVHKDRARGREQTEQQDKHLVNSDNCEPSTHPCANLSTLSG
jgi:hypothetical protein